ncbi:MAG: ORF6N domain-containing protein [Burkholderiaceae bacterium]|nr:ORF6N domain-containing protein [Burkholderiaceae bacterium]
MSAGASRVSPRVIYAASVAAIPPIDWSDERVITTDLLAKAYGASASNIHDNHRKNAERFEEGKHFYRLVGDELRRFKALPGNIPVSAKARSLILWTERGAARHAKMLETDAAWDVFEALEDSYFHHRAAPAGGEVATDADRSTVVDREPLLHAAIRMVVKHRLPFHKVYQTMNYFAGSMRFAVMTKAQVAEAERFIERLLLGQDTRADWLRIGANKRELTGDDAQPELLGFAVPGTLGNWQN